MLDQALFVNRSIHYWAIGGATFSFENFWKPSIFQNVIAAQFSLTAHSAYALAGIRVRERPVYDFDTLFPYQICRVRVLLAASDPLDVTDLGRTYDSSEEKTRQFVILILFQPFSSDVLQIGGQQIARARITVPIRLGLFHGRLFHGIGRFSKPSLRIAVVQFATPSINLLVPLFSVPV